MYNYHNNGAIFGVRSQQCHSYLILLYNTIDDFAS